MNEFERVLHEKCQIDSDLQLLEHQWAFDKRLITQALQSVGSLFPHYSLHDASHSSTILVQIARVLGSKRITMLSATDLWLLLEAAWSHDLGMVVSDEQAREWYSNKDFKLHLNALLESDDDELRQAAILLSNRETLKESSEDWPFHVWRALILVLADYARRKHPEQSKRIIKNPSLIDRTCSPCPRDPALMTW